ncbi:hypothetical protein DFH06DRAFT_210709 [Mycena polygramma]|nr:hypothetical protein DFH06DRAFT_210709 [Mycena polygramma]
MQPDNGPSNSIAAYLEEICTRHEAEKAAVAEKMRLKEERQARRKRAIAKDSGDKLAGTSMITRSSTRRDTGENNALDNVRLGEDTLQQNDGDAEKIELLAQRGRLPVKGTGKQPEQLPSPSLRPRAASCPPIPQRSDTVVRFPKELNSILRNFPREDSTELSIIVWVPPCRKRPVPAAESPDTTVAPSGASAVHGVAARASKRRRLDSAAGTSELPSHCPPSPSLSLSTLTPPPSDSQPPEEKTCSHCRSTVTPCWQYSTLTAGCEVCYACYGYENKHYKSRPLELEMKRSQRGVKECAHCGVTSSLSWEYSKLKLGSKLCHPCAQYERTHKKVRPPALFQRSQRRGPTTSSSRLRGSRRSA